MDGQGGRSSRALTGTTFTDNCSSILAELVCHQTVGVGSVTPGLKPIAPQGFGQWWPAVMCTWRSSDSDREGPTHLFVGPLSCSRSGRLAALRSRHNRGCQAHA